MEKIKGGYYIKARKIQESEIAHAPPHVREIWDFLLMKCNHSNNKSIKRGQCLTSYKEIQNALSWYIGWRKQAYTKSQCEISMKWLKNATMITTKKTTRGMIVTVLNYDYYQNPKNYESHKETRRRATREPQTDDTIYKNDKNENTLKELYSSFIEMFNQITKRNFEGTKKDERQFNARINEGATIEDFKTAIENGFKDSRNWQSPNHFTPEYITRSDKLQKYLNYGIQSDNGSNAESDDKGYQPFGFPGSAKKDN